MCSLAQASALLLLLMLSACSTPPTLPDGFGGQVALEAWRSDTSLQIKYIGPNGLMYSFADWRGEVAVDASLPDAVSVAVIDPDVTGRNPWTRPPGTVRPLPILPASEYRRFRNRLLTTMVPTTGTEAITVALGDQDITLYFDSQGHFHSTFSELPGDIRIVARYSLEDYLQTAPEILKAQLVELGVSGSEVLFNTGDVDEDALPFLYANVDTRLGAYFRLPPPGEKPVEQLTFVPVTRSMMHLVQSHTTQLVSRAATSVVRLMFVVSHAATDTFDLAPLLIFETDPIPPLKQGPAMDLALWELELDRLLGRRSERGELDYLIDGAAFFERFEAAIRSASKSIQLRTYIFDNDDYALSIADLLRDRARQGVDVKVLFDGIGTLAALANPASELPEGYEPPQSIESYLETDSTVDVRRLPNPFLTGDHTKTTIVDSRLAYLGGMNIAREYRYEWHDMMVELRGPVVAALADDFDIAWAGAGPFGDIGQFFAHLQPDHERGPEFGYPLRLLYTKPMSSEIRMTQLAAIRRAQQYVYVQNAYLTDDSFLLELVKARRRGVDVRVIIPLESDRGQLTRDNILAANALFSHGVRIYVYPGMSHIKAAIIDGWACLGSANLDQLSLRVNLETNIATSEPEAVDALREQLFEKDFKASPEMRQPFPEIWTDRLWEMVGDYIF